jgi:hypothetical protein
MTTPTLTTPRRRRRPPRTLRRWIVFYLDEGVELETDAIGRSKEQAWSRFRRLFPKLDVSGGQWKVRQVTITIDDG